MGTMNGATENAATYNIGESSKVYTENMIARIEKSMGKIRQWNGMITQSDSEIKCHRLHEKWIF